MLLVVPASLWISMRTVLGMRRAPRFLIALCDYYSLRIAREILEVETDSIGRQRTKDWLGFGGILDAEI